jgi:hypothetical protein
MLEHPDAGERLKQDGSAPWVTITVPGHLIAACRTGFENGQDAEPVCR